MSLLQNPMHPGEVLKELYLTPLEMSAIALAKRLGAHHERTYANVHMGEEMLFRHPGPTGTTDPANTKTEAPA